MRDLVLVSPHSPAKVLAILEREMDRYPGVLRTLLTLNAHYFAGTAPVCGKVGGAGFEMRNRSGPFLSLRATGTVCEISGGSKIVLALSRPWIPDPVGILLKRYDRDLEIILAFLGQWLSAKAPAQDRDHK